MSLYSHARRAANSSRIVQQYLNKKRSREKKTAVEHFQSVGYEVHDKLYSVLKDTEFRWFALSGTLLGIIRENGFIPYDDDLDYGVMIEDNQTWHRFKDLLQENGIILRHHYTENELITEMAFSYNGVHIDFFGMRDYGTHLLSSICYRRKNRNYEKNEASTMHITFPPFIGIKEVECKGSVFPVPINGEEFLVCNYGSNWRIPDRNVTLETEIGTREYCDDLLSIIHRNKNREA